METCSGEKLHFLAVPLPGLLEGSIADFDIYISTTTVEAPVLYRERNLQIDRSVLERLAELKHSHIYVHPDDAHVYQSYVERHLDVILNDDRLSSEEKSRLLYDSAQGMMRELMEAPRGRNIVSRSSKLVGTTLDYLSRDKAAFRCLVQVISYDYYTYTHSVNVFLFSIALAQYVGCDATPLLRAFGEGVLLHDIGKSKLDPAITNCRGKLTEEQWEAMKQHPVLGYDILKNEGGVSDLALDVVRHHHEKLDGTGYPDRLRNGEISFFVRITTIADVFDALTTRRSYKDALDSFPALRLMKDEMREQIDRNLFDAFVKRMGAE
jgi:HD-GYP domain-containing protein (c-di-GMP phosphodiesterase class II)